MRTVSKTKLFLTAAGLTLVINVSTNYSIKPDPVPGEPEIHRSEAKPDYFQEKSGYRFAGAEKCASVCHNDDKMGFQYNMWKGSPHSDAFNILASKKAEKFKRKAGIKEDPQESQVCLKCHITGSGVEAQNFATSYKKEEGVTCEACHKQRTGGITYLPDEGDCLNCHEGLIHKISKFNFREMSARIAHPRPAPGRI